MFFKLIDSAIALAIGAILIIAGIYLTTPRPPVPDFQAPPAAIENLDGLEPEIITEDLIDAMPPELPAADEPVSESILEESETLERPETVQLPEKEIDITAIALVRCLFKTQFYAESVQPWNEAQYNIGTGAFISPDGYILTARHILEVRRELLDDPVGRMWELQKCEIAMTDQEQSEIPPVKNWREDEERFKPVEIFFKTSDEDYAESAGLDFAVLKLSETDDDLPYFELFPQLLLLEKESPIIAIGYPGRESASAQRLERFDGEFFELTYYEGSGCDGTIQPCGLRYGLRRYPADHQEDFWKATDLGIITPYFRGGFSGAPVFLSGNFIGIVTHGRSGNYTESGWDEAFILTSYDIFENLKTIPNFQIGL